jgi:hypothetical protein
MQSKVLYAFEGSKGMWEFQNENKMKMLVKVHEQIKPTQTKQ